MAEIETPATAESAAVPPIPEGLCGVGGCVYLAGHETREYPLTGVEARHTWDL